MGETGAPFVEVRFENRPIRPVDSFESNYVVPSTVATQHLYPGERPEGSYVTDGLNAYPMEVSWDDEGIPHFMVKTEEGIIDIDQLLLAEGTEPMDRRIPIVSFGANVCPAALKSKFTVNVEEVELNEFGRPVYAVGEDGKKKMILVLDAEGHKMTHIEREDLLLVPTLYGSLKGFDVVHHDSPGQKANFFAELYAGPETVDTEVSVAISFLTQEQLLMLHATEPSYDLAGVGSVDIGQGHSLPAIFYAGKSSVLLKEDVEGVKRPVALAGVSARNRGLEAATSEEALGYVLSLPEVSEVLIQNVERFAREPITTQSYTDEALGRKELVDKKELQKLVADRLKALELRGVELLTEMPGMNFYSWSNPSLLPNLRQMLEGNTYSPDALILLPEQVLSNHPEPNRTQLLSKIKKHYKDSKIPA
jgi:hypothetical protein